MEFLLARRSGEGDHQRKLFFAKDLSGAASAEELPDGTFKLSTSVTDLRKKK